MPSVSMALPFEPTPKGRPIFKARYNKFLAITPPKTKAFEMQVAFYYRGAADGYTFPKGTPITVSIEFGMRIPASTSKKRREAMLRGEIHHVIKPDIDNLTKAVLDGLNGVAWYDDSQITELHVFKRYVQSPNIYITIHETNKKTMGVN